MWDFTPAELLERIDPKWLQSKNEQLIHIYKHELSSVVRYLHNGQILPLEIEKSVWTLIRYLGRLQHWQTYKDEIGDILFINKAVKQEFTFDKYIIEFNNITKWQLFNVEIESIMSKKRNCMTRLPFREIRYNNRSYRSVQEDGDVFSHLMHQHQRYMPEYLDPLLEEWIINPTQRILLELFHTVHDLPEKHADIGDVFAFAKKEDGGALEGHKVVNDMIQARIPYTQEEYRLMPLLFKYYEWRKTLFKLGEMLGYIKNGFSSMKNPQYFNSGELLWPQLIALVVENILANNSYSLIDPKTLELHSYKPLDLGPVRKFFQDNTTAIEDWLTQGIYFADSIATNENKFRSRESFEKIAKSYESIKIPTIY